CFSPSSVCYPLSLHDPLPISRVPPQLHDHVPIIVAVQSQPEHPLPLRHYPALVTRHSVERCGVPPLTGSCWSLWTRRFWLAPDRSEEHTSELQSRSDLVCRLL